MSPLVASMHLVKSGAISQYDHAIHGHRRLTLGGDITVAGDFPSLLSVLGRGRGRSRGVTVRSATKEHVANTVADNRSSDGTAHSRCGLGEQTGLTAGDLSSGGVRGRRGVLLLVRGVRGGAGLAGLACWGGRSGRSRRGSGRRSSRLRRGQCGPLEQELVLYLTDRGMLDVAKEKL